MRGGLSAHPLVQPAQHLAAGLLEPYLEPLAVALSCQPCPVVKEALELVSVHDVEVELAINLGYINPLGAVNSCEILSDDGVLVVAVKASQARTAGLDACGAALNVAALVERYSLGVVAEAVASPFGNYALAKVAVVASLAVDYIRRAFMLGIVSILGFYGIVDFIHFVYPFQVVFDLSSVYSIANRYILVNPFLKIFFLFLKLFFLSVFIS